MYKYGVPYLHLRAGAQGRGWTYSGVYHRCLTQGLLCSKGWQVLDEYCLFIQFSRGRQWHPTPVLLPGKSHGWKSLVGCSPWGRKESDTTERLHFHFSLSCIGEGNGNPLQYSCLENPRPNKFPEPFPSKIKQPLLLS